MAYHQLQTIQHLSASIDEVWHFISSPRNLKHITPSYLGFEITSQNLPEVMHTGMIITYKVRPLWGIPLRWMTEITHVEPLRFFIDEQRYGPYTLWHHQHHIRPIEGGVEMKDLVTYVPPLGVIGEVANTLFIHKQLKSIFDFRHHALEQQFGAWKR